MTIKRYIDFVFVHAYSSQAANWAEVMVGASGRKGRLQRAQELAAMLGLPVRANDKLDEKNRALFIEHGIENFATALNTEDEVRTALDASPRRSVLFVSSPDHLPRIAREALAYGGERCLFAASDVPFSDLGAKGVEVREPVHMKHDNGE